MQDVFKPIPKVLQGKGGVVIHVNAKILSDRNALEDACENALSKVAENIVKDVTSTRRNVFADNKSRWAYPDGGYDNAANYYRSMMIPYWRGGLLGSFEQLGYVSGNRYLLMFTASYASKIEKGGIAEGAPERWFEDKGIDSKKSRKKCLHAHPYVKAVASKIQWNLKDFNYLSTFEVHFSHSFK